MPRYELSEKAELDLLEIALYGFENHGEQQTIKYRDAIKERFDDIAQSPLMYTAVDGIREGYRRGVIGEHAIYYRIINDDTIKIMRILRSQNPFSQLEAEE